MSTQPDPRPSRLAHRLHDTAADLAALLATDIQIDPIDVVAPLTTAAGHLAQIADEIADAADPVDSDAARAARQAAGHCRAAADRLGHVAARLLPPEPPAR